MDAIAANLEHMSRVAIPRSVPGLVTQRALLMSFEEGLPLTRLEEKTKHLPRWKREKVKGGLRGGQDRCEEGKILLTPLPEPIHSRLGWTCCAVQPVQGIR